MSSGTRTFLHVCKMWPRYRTLVPARTVVGVRPATAAEAAAAGVPGVRGGGGGAASPPLVMEFTSELNAR